MNSSVSTMNNKVSEIGFAYDIDFSVSQDMNRVTKNKLFYVHNY